MTDKLKIAYEEEQEKILSLWYKYLSNDKRSFIEYFQEEHNIKLTDTTSNESNFAFDILGSNELWDRTYLGSAMILGVDDEGESIECKSKLDDIKSMIKFRGKVAIENDGQGFTLTPWHIYQNNLEEARLLLEKLNLEKLTKQ